jgi:hypothetical protein
MWTAVFAVVTIVAAIFIVSIKRAVTSKALHTTDYLLWSIWGNDVKEEGGWNAQQIGTATSKTVSDVDSKVLERKGKVRAIINATAVTTSDSSSWQ